VHEDLIEFSDFFPTLAELTGQQPENDGKSFYPLLSGGDYQPRETAFVYYDPRWGDFVNQYRNKLIRTLDYKLYQDGSFYFLPDDLDETNPLEESALSPEVRRQKEELQSVLEQYPDVD
jgi:arylsulfatase A